MSEIYQFKITLAHSKPSIWRRVLVPSSFSLRKFHDVIQTCFNWDGSHLYLFDIYKEILADKNHPDYEEVLEWMGEDFIPELFNIAQINK